MGQTDQNGQLYLKRSHYNLPISGEEPSSDPARQDPAGFQRGCAAAAAGGAGGATTPAPARNAYTAEKSLPA
jgi:hypothetical protein